MTEQQLRQLGWLKDQLRALGEMIQGLRRVCDWLAKSENAVIGIQPMWMAIEIIRSGVTTLQRGWNLANYFIEEAEKHAPPPPAAPAPEKKTWRSRLRGSSRKT